MGSDRGSRLDVDETMDTFTVVFEQDSDWWVGSVGELPGALTQGRTLYQTRENLRDAVLMVPGDESRARPTGARGPPGCSRIDDVASSVKRHARSPNFARTNVSCHTMSWTKHFR